MSSVEEFYNNLSLNYHLQFSDWEESLKYQSMVIDNLIGRYLHQKPENIKLLDCSCGIGTQAIGLALKGYNVSATDLSEKAVKRCKEEADKHNVNIKCKVADFRTLEKQIDGLFNCIISFDNALPHLFTREDLYLGIKNIYNKLNAGGIFLASIRDYDSALEHRTKVQPPYVHDDENGRRITLQVWDWNEDNTYKMNLYIINHQGNECITNYDYTMYKAWTRAEMTEVMRECGFKNIQWHMPDETQFYQPIVICFK